MTLQNNFILINNYLLRAGLFSNPISYLNIIDFINTHIFPGNNIEVCLYIDQTIIYYDNECQKYIINTEDIKQILTHRPLILDTNLMSLFQIQKPDLPKLKLELINNHFRYTMYQIFGKKYQSSEDMITLMVIALYPNCHIRNPFTYHHFENQTTSESNRINTPLTKEDCEFLRTLNVKNTLDDFILECFPQISANEKINIKNSIENSIPTCVKNIISQLTSTSSDHISNDVDVIDYVYKIAYFFNNNYLDLFQLFPPSTDELLAFFYCHKNQWQSKTLSQSNVPPIWNDNINYIQLFIAKKLLNTLPGALENISPNKSQNEIYYDYKAYKNMIYTQLRMPNIQDTSSKTLISFIKSVQDLPTPFSTLLTILSGITNNSIDALKNTMSLISRVYLGPELFETITNKTAFPSFTIIYCNNPLYVKKFLEDLFSFYTRSYSLYSLANKENIPKFIKDKLVGILANIDCSESSFTDLSQFQKLIKGNLISVNDESLSKISHRSTLYYIYITSNKAVAEKQFNNCNYHTIDLTGDLALGKYKQLVPYEIALFSLASVFWWTNAYITKTENDQTSFDISDSVESISLTTNQKIDQFLSEFCINITNTIDKSEIDKEIKDIGLAASELRKSKNDSLRKESAKQLHITDLDFIYKDDLKYVFDEWYKITYSELSLISEDDFTEYIISKLGSMFYIKDETHTFKYNEKRGQKGKARGFYGLTINKRKLQEYIKEKTVEQETKNTAALQEQFASYFEEIINDTIAELLGLTKSHG